ncbi:PAS domain S-box protein [Pantanalinema rosaneae CENA516]|uniref:PAS domain S-box protein n=1 Tax=Pantanalinema rosaneae TaxID=1620701 RepID=UPI003D6F24C5
MAFPGNRWQRWHTSDTQLPPNLSNQSHYLAISITLIYALLGVLWITWSDYLLARLSPSTDILSQLQTVKGWLFIGCTSLLLYGLIQRGVKHLRRSQRFLLSIINSTHDAILVKNMQGQYLVVNQAAAHILGLHPAAMLGRVADDFLAPQEAEQLRSLEQTVLHTGQANEIEQCLTIAGTPHWFSITTSLCRDEQAKPLGLINVVRDITRRKQAEAESQYLERLQLELGLLENVLEVALASYWDWDLLHHQKYLSPNFKQMLGYKDHELPNTPETWQDLILPEDLPGLFQCFDRHVQSRGEILYYNEVRYRHKNGSIVWVICSGRVIAWDAQSRPLRMVGCHIDITERKQAEEALKLSEARYRAIVEDQTDLIARFLPDGRMLFVNEAYYRYFDVQQQDVIGQSYEPVVFAADRAHVAQQLKTLTPDNPTVTIENRVVVNEEIRWTQWVSHLLMNQQQQVMEVQAVGRDITKLKQVERALQRYERIVAIANDGIALLDRHYHYQLVNAAYLTWCNRQESEVVGHTVAEILGTELFTTVIQPKLDRCLAGELIQYERWFDFPNLVPQFLSVTYVPYLDSAEQTISGVVVSIRDLSALKLAQEALEKSEHRFATLAATAPVAIFRMDMAGNCIYVNDRWSEMTGRPTATAMVTGWVQTIHPDDRDRITSTWAQWLQASQPDLYRNEARLLRPDGSTIWFYCQVRPETDSSGALIGYVGILADISDRKQAEEQLQHINQQLANTNAELAQATRLKDEFLANMSHELRTPLNAILGMSESLQDEVLGDINQRQRKALATIERSGKHLLDLINDILDLSKIEAGKLELTLNAVSVQNLCQTSLTAVQSMALKKQIQLHHNIPGNLGTIQADERRLHQALLNLLSNAIKFTPEGGSVTLAVSRQSSDRANLAQNSTDWISFSVTDTGIGIAAADLNKLFQPFVQIDSSLNRHYSGTGLGLSLVRRIAELHGGSVTVQSQLGQGSCFTLRIPEPHSLTLPIPPPVISLEADDRLTTQSATLSPSDHLAAVDPPLILLAEDNLANVETISGYLETRGYRLIVANHGQEAIDLTQAHHPDLILMDIQMPGMDGIEAMQRIRQHPEFTDLPIIALTALAMSGDRERCLAAGAAAYLAKPVSLKHLTTIIQQLLEIPQT